MTSTEFAHEWIEAWNSHDLERIMTHYADEVDFTSPVILRLLGIADGRIKGKADLKAYFKKGLEAYPDLHFELQHVLDGMNSVTLVYKSINNTLSAELMELDSEGKACRVKAHYKPL